MRSSTSKAPKTALRRNGVAGRGVAEAEGRRQERGPPEGGHDRRFWAEDVVELRGAEEQLVGARHAEGSPAGVGGRVHLKDADEGESEADEDDGEDLGEDEQVGRHLLDDDEEDADLGRESGPVLDEPAGKRTRPWVRGRLSLRAASPRELCEPERDGDDGDREERGVDLVARARPRAGPSASERGDEEQRVADLRDGAAGGLLRREDSGDVVLSCVRERSVRVCVCMCVRVCVCV